MQTLYALLFVLGVGYVHGHGFMIDPMSRHALWALPENQRPDLWWERTFWDSQGVWCDNVPQDVNFSNCGRCGDPPGNRDFNLNNVYGHPIITGTYNAGSVIRVDIEFGAMHFGYIEMDLCAEESETDTCFQRLTLVGGSHPLRGSQMMCVPLDGTVTRHEFVMVQLPEGVRCNRCTLRWSYRTSYPGPANWDPCFDSRPVAQTFRGCSNIRIQ